MTQIYGFLTQESDLDKFLTLVLQKRRAIFMKEFLRKVKERQKRNQFLGYSLKELNIMIFERKMQVCKVGLFSQS